MCLCSPFLFEHVLNFEVGCAQVGTGAAGHKIRLSCRSRKPERRNGLGRDGPGSWSDERKEGDSVASAPRACVLCVKG